MRGDTVLGDAAGRRPAPDRRADRRCGVALATDGNGRYCQLDPYAGTQLALAEAYRNVAATGARPLAVTNCLNFGSPEDPAVMWQFTEAVRGLADGCLALGIPVTGGNVSFYNQTGGTAIQPTPVVGVLGVHDDVRRRLSIRLRRGRAPASCCSAGPRPSSAARCGPGSRTATSAAGRPPWTWTPSARSPAVLVAAGAPAACSTAAHDLSDGGLALALAECCLAGGSGCTGDACPATPFVGLFSESAARAVVAVRPDAEAGFAGCAPAHGVPAAGIGVHRRPRPRGQPAGSTIPLAELAARTAGRCRPCSADRPGQCAGPAHHQKAMSWPSGPAAEAGCSPAGAAAGAAERRPLAVRHRPLARLRNW